MYKIVCNGARHASTRIFHLLIHDGKARESSHTHLELLVCTIMQNIISEFEGENETRTLSYVFWEKAVFVVCWYYRIIPYPNIKANT